MYVYLQDICYLVCVFVSQPVYMDMQILGVWFEQFAQQITRKLKTQTETGSETETQSRCGCGFRNSGIQDEDAEDSGSDSDSDSESDSGVLGGTPACFGFLRESCWVFSSDTIKAACSMPEFILCGSKLFVQFSILLKFAHSTIMF